ncbi:phage tail assembly chaperone [Thermus sp.]|uniref:phage tail assembly chaperone n=1 Tax=Thermus sp. TaxID=275 RepID=UPI00260D1499|nr:phage tail assembly chaperone [Thermus sp.]MCX7850972.1 phage tail assembly chaperone [Thermus sp.]
MVEFLGLSLADAGLLTVRDGKPALKGEDEIRREERERALARLRAERNQRLAATDWVVVRAAERGEEVPAEWRAYRQALRDLPETVDEEALLSGDIPWPEPPQFPR